jgi:hypothetical protein
LRHVYEFFHHFLEGGDISLSPGFENPRWTLVAKAAASKERQAGGATPVIHTVPAFDSTLQVFDCPEPPFYCGSFGAKQARGVY